MSTSMAMGSTSMSASLVPTSTLSSMSMPSATDAAMFMSSRTMSNMNFMAVTFFTSSTTPLYSTSWVPTGTGQYTGTCIFLVIFSALFRGLLAVRVQFYPLLNKIDKRRDGELVYQPYRDEKATRHEWRAKEAVLLGMLDMLLAGVAYLLMIAVMTMNVGYFLSVLAGVFVGSIVFGRFLATSAAH